MKKTAFIALFILSSLVIMSAYNANTINAVQEPIANLVFKTNGGGIRPDYGLFIAQYLRDIGIDLEVKIEEWSVFVGELLVTHDYDCGIVGIQGGALSPEFRSAYTEGGSLNLFGLEQEIPYQNQSENMQQEALTILDLNEKQALLYEWQQLCMDKIVPICPLFTRRAYVGTWSNTLGYDYDWGLIASMPYMSYSGIHDGQVSTNEWNWADAMWRELNPMFGDDTASSNINAFTFESGLEVNPDANPIKTGLIYDWDRIDEYHYKYYVRDNVYWNPSYNVTWRTSSSPALDTIPVGELMVGLKDGSYSDGTNQQVTAKDFVFSYIAWAFEYLSEDPAYFDWMSACYVDPSDPLAFHIEIDGDMTTPEKEQYVDYWNQLVYMDIMPEFFLNSTDSVVYETIGGIPLQGLYGAHPGNDTDITDTPQWTYYSSSSFGCGMYMLDYYVPHSVTVMKRSPFWHGIGKIDGVSGKVPFVETVNVRVIPDITAELAEFKAGKLDWTSLTNFPTERKQMQADPRFTVQSQMPARYDFFFYNLQRPFVGGEDNFVFLDEPGKEEYTKGVAVRKAMNYAIDRVEINEVLLEGEGIICHSVTYPYHAFWYYNDIVKYDRDLEAAQEWLAAAGYTITIEAPIPIIGVVAAIGAAAFIVFYRKRK